MCSKKLFKEKSVKQFLENFIENKKLIITNTDRIVLFDNYFIDD